MLLAGILARERLNHPHSGIRLGELAGEHGHRYPRPSVGDLRFFGEDPHGDHHERHHGKRDQGESRRQRHHDGDGEAERQNVAESLNDAVAEQLVDRLHVVDHARDNHAARDPVEVGERQALKVTHQVAAHLLQQPLANDGHHLHLRPVRQEGGEVGQHRQAEEDGHAADVAVGDVVVDRHLRPHRSDRHQRRLGDGHRQGERHTPAVREDVRQRPSRDARVVDRPVDVGDVGQHARSGAAVQTPTQSAAAPALHHEMSSFSNSPASKTRSRSWTTSSGSAS